MKYSLIVLSYICTLASPLVNAQGFDLFDAMRGKVERKATPKIPANPSPTPGVEKDIKIKKTQPQRATTQKDFALFGTSRIGSRYTVFLQSPNGKRFTQTWKTGISSPIKDNSDFQLMAVTPRSVKIGYPTSAPCNKNNAKKNVKCSGDGKFATVSLMRAKSTTNVSTSPLSGRTTPSQQNNNGAINNPALQNIQALRQQRGVGLKRREGAYKHALPARNDKGAPSGAKAARTSLADRLTNR